ncbi:hypothetical protein Tco_0965464 [Tanacetum coccineum]
MTQCHTINVISRNEDTQLYETILPVALTKKDIRNSESYKEYYADASVMIPQRQKEVRRKAVQIQLLRQKPPTVPKEVKEKKSDREAEAKVVNIKMMYVHNDDENAQDEKMKNRLIRR